LKHIADPLTVHVCATAVGTIAITTAIRRNPKGCALNIAASTDL
jgi:hypothetical protein